MPYVNPGETVALGCDHGGFILMDALGEYLDGRGIAVTRFGSAGEPVDYPDVAEAACREVTSGNAKCGILVCGTGIGMSIAANKIPGIRAAVCGESYSAKFTRLHNDANVLCLGARVIGAGEALEVVEAFLDSEFEGGRHKTRVDKIAALEDRCR